MIHTLNGNHYEPPVIRDHYGEEPQGRGGKGRGGYILTHVRQARPKMEEIVPWVPFGLKLVRMSSVDVRNTFASKTFPGGGPGGLLVA